MSQKRIVVTGMGVVSCFGNDVETFYDNLLEGKSGVKTITRFPCEEFPTRFGATVDNFSSDPYLDKKQARRVDPYIAYTSVAGKKALESGKVTPEILESFDKNRCGILVGSGMGGMNVFSKGLQDFLEKGHRKITPFFIPYIITNMGGGLLAIDLGFMGPNYSISTACATANYCFTAAANHIRNGEADLMLCGGAEAAINPIGLAGFVSIKALSTRNETPETASRPWDKTRDGFVMGEGAGVLMLESLDHALKRGAPIYAEYLGGAISCDAYHMTNLRDDGKGIMLSLEKAIADAGIEKKDINYVNAHATSTPAGDLVEAEAVQSFFKETSHIKMNGTKSMIGHCLGASGGLEAIATIQAIRRNKVHPTINVTDPDPSVKIDIVQGQAQDHEITAALSNSFGFGGHNSSIIFAPYREKGIASS